MRPINADALKITLDTFATIVGFIGVYDRGQVMECIDAAPTVATDTNVLGKWISVKDRLPPKNESVLYCAFGRSVGEGVYHGFDGVHHVWMMYAVSGTHWDDEVTHWMPLPEPPKEVSGDG